jgi:sulfonate transport system substrate-binding protein
MLKPLLSLVAAILFTTGCAATAQDTPPGEVVLRVGDQKGGAKALLTAAGLLNDFPYKIEWSTFTSGPPIMKSSCTVEWLTPSGSRSAGARASEGHSQAPERS